MPECRLLTISFFLDSPVRYENTIMFDKFPTSDTLYEIFVCTLLLFYMRVISFIKSWILFGYMLTICGSGFEFMGIIRMSCYRIPRMDRPKWIHNWSKSIMKSSLHEYCMPPSSTLYNISHSLSRMKCEFLICWNRITTPCQNCRLRDTKRVFPKTRNTRVSCYDFLNQISTSEEFSISSPISLCRVGYLRFTFKSKSF